MAKEQDKAKEIVQEDSLFEGINLSNKREENETYEDYRARLKEKDMQTRVSARFQTIMLGVVFASLKRSFQ